MKKLFLKLRYLLLAIVMVIGCYTYVWLTGDEYVCEVAGVSQSETGEMPVAVVEDSGQDTLKGLSFRKDRRLYLRSERSLYPHESRNNG